MAYLGKAYFDNKHATHATPESATCSDIAAMLGKVGDGEGLAPGIAKTILEKRATLEQLFAEHDAMLASHERVSPEVLAA